MNVGHTEVFVKDPALAKEFYVDVLGFEIETIQRERLVWLKKGPLTILLRPGRKASSPATYQEAPIGLVFYTDDLKKTSEELRQRGLKFLGTDGSESCLTFSDHDGNWFQLVNPQSF